VRVAVRVDSSSSSRIRDGLGVGAVAGSENEVGVKCGGRGRPKAAILFLDGAFGGNCGTAIGVLGSGWMDPGWAWCWPWGLCAVRRCGAGGPRLFLGFLGGGFGGNCGCAGGRARRNQDGLGAGWRRGGEKEEVEAGAGARFFLGWGGLCLVGTAAPQSGWAADGPGMGFVRCWSWRS
jgi:hypothetical protein